MCKTELYSPSIGHFPERQWQDCENRFQSRECLIRDAFLNHFPSPFFSRCWGIDYSDFSGWMLNLLWLSSSIVSPPGGESPAAILVRDTWGTGSVRRRRAPIPHNNVRNPNTRTLIRTFRPSTTYNKVGQPYYVLVQINAYMVYILYIYLDMYIIFLFLRWDVCIHRIHHTTHITRQPFSPLRE